MTKSRLHYVTYHLIPVLPVLLGFGNFILSLRFFGISEQTDAYLAASSLMAICSAVAITLVDQFLHFFQEINAKDSVDAKHFFDAAFTFSLGIGAIFWLVFVFFSSTILELMFPGFLPHTLGLTRRIVLILSPILLFMAVGHVSRGVMNSKASYLLPYTVAMLPSLGTLCAYAIIAYSDVKNIELLCYGSSVGGLLGFGLSLWALQKLHFLPRIGRTHHLIRAFIKNSFLVRMAGNVHFVLGGIVTNHFLSSYQHGAISTYYYAEKASAAIAGLSYGPAQSAFIARSSHDWYANSGKKISSYVKQYLRYSGSILAVSSTVTYLILPLVIGVISPNLNAESIESLRLFYSIMLVWKLILLIEVPCVILLEIAKKYKAFFVVNSLFVVMLYQCANFLKPYYGVEAILLAGIISQIINFMIYLYLARRLVHAHG